MLIPVIMAGGVGSRLWPASRALLPKQFIRFPGRSASLFQESVSRVRGFADISAPLVLCNFEHRFLVAEQLRELEITDSSILLEPVGRSTAPAVAMAALSALARDENAVLLIQTADHVLPDVAAFQKAVVEGVALARDGMLVTFGIVPGSPETGYGYIEQGDTIEGRAAKHVARFVEKPDRATAEAYLASGRFLWNSGMFLFGAARYLQELEQHAPDIVAACKAAHAALVVGPDFQTIPEPLFAACRSDSIDYAVMEKTASAAVVALDAGWNDLGSWDALWATGAKDSDGNVISGDVLTEAVSNSYIQSQSRLVAAVGLQDTVVVETADAVLVAQRDRVQAVKHIVAALEAGSRSESSLHRRVDRPWGSYESLASGNGFQVKHIVVKPGAALSLQMHHRRAEHWTVIRGTGLVRCDDREFELQVNESTFIPLGSTHRLSNPGAEPVELIEVQLGDYLGEDDIVRFEDRYGRVQV